MESKGRASVVLGGDEYLLDEYGDMLMNLKDRTLLKERFLLEYYRRAIPVFCSAGLKTVDAGYVRYSYIVDLFCGLGLYRNEDGELIWGSPLVVLEAYIDGDAVPDEVPEVLDTIASDAQSSGELAI